MQLKGEHRDSLLSEEKSRREFKTKDRECDLWQQKYETSNNELNSMMAKNV